MAITRLFGDCASWHCGGVLHLGLKALMVGCVIIPEPPGAYTHYICLPLAVFWTSMSDVANTLHGMSETQHARTNIQTFVRIQTMSQRPHLTASWVQPKSNVIGLHALARRTVLIRLAACLVFFSPSNQIPVRRFSTSYMSVVPGFVEIPWLRRYLVMPALKSTSMYPVSISVTSAEAGSQPWEQLI